MGNWGELSKQKSSMVDFKFLLIMTLGSSHVCHVECLVHGGGLAPRGLIETRGEPHGNGKVHTST